PLAAPGDLFRGCAAAAQHGQSVLNKGAGPGRLAKEGGPALRRLMESADQIGVVLEVVGDMRDSVSDMPPFVLTRHPEDRGRDGISPEAGRGRLGGPRWTAGPAG